MKVVVTGGSGRLGQHTIRELLAHEHQVLSLDKAPPPERPLPFMAGGLDERRIGS